MQHYYNTHMFKSTSQALQEEDIRVETEVAYFDNEPILELLSSQVCTYACLRVPQHDQDIDIETKFTLPTLHTNMK